ncbi:MAG: hypothetical protein AAGD06_02495 [Acidobacteriota bacterium]
MSRFRCLFCCLITLAILVVGSPAFAEKPADTLEDAVEPGRDRQVRIDPGFGDGPVDNREMTIVDPKTLEIIEAKWKHLITTMNRSHRHEPLPAVGVKAEDVRPWKAPSGAASRNSLTDPLLLEANTNPVSVAPSGFSSTVNEPSVAATNDYVFYTANWYAASSTDGGNSWSYVNPYTGPFPEPAGETFCCDQQAHYDDGTNAVFWLHQLIPDGSTDNGTQRVNVDQGADGTWDCFYDLTPQDAGFAQATWPDYPDMSVSDQHLFVTSNVFPSGPGSFVGAFVARLPLADIGTCQSTTADYHTETSFGSFRTTQGAGDTMYFADHQTTTSIRVWSWPQASSAPTSVLRTINAFLTGTRVCPGPDGRDFCGFIDSRIFGGAVAGNQVAFFWTPQQNAGGGFPFPYSQGVVLDAGSNLAVTDQPLIWSNDAAWIYPSLASNASGGFGGTVLWGGGTFFPQCSAFLADAENSTTFNPLEHTVVISGTTGPSSNRSGDYLSTRTYHPNNEVYAGSCFSYFATGAGSSRYVLFGRTSDFNGGNTAPAVTITAPADGSTVDVATSVAFAGTATDAEDGNLTSGLAWSSSLDGNIGSGGSFSTSSLSLGAHTITASVTDSGSLTGSASINLTVSDPNSNGPQNAVYDGGLGAPACGVAGSSCDSGTLLEGRANLGPESNQPNTLDGCTDGTAGTYQSDESNERIVVSTLDGSDFTEGATVQVDATVYAWSTGAADTLDLYYAADANSPSWTLIGSIVPPGGGIQTLSAQYTLPAGSLQAIRANFRYQGSQSSCSGGTYDDADDLVFAVGGGGGTPTPVAEWGNASVGGTAVTVNLGNTYTSPVVVATIQYVNNTTPVVTRISNVTGSSFDVRLQNPSGGSVATDNVSYLVVEEGQWTVDGLTFEAFTFNSTVTDENNSWVGQAQSYGQAYTSPVVIGQVMSENDSAWSVFWNQGNVRTNPPSASALTAGKTVCEDPTVARANETVGVIVFEAAHGNLGGVEVEAALGADSVRGVTNNPPFAYTFNTAFASAPTVGLATMAGVDGGNGGWAYTFGTPMATATSFNLVIDEDQVNDPERAHTPEQVGYVVFAGAGSAAQ